ncbi:hypothetical protein [cf. Phormidesmis sp. LEGE 11477]|uniref:hypothetical protein n=1 Tax=cf. Phormidesmis sp. LEGE 11477 TaxID=1828680 RepID=UPI00187E2C37|nr:hypothetical protein [cf. Phormidesmis sp. LEGE 11477]MBE9064258.1 hypothetical protein [cf. Phormidesmis sp. LEGE 11477]
MIQPSFTEHSEDIHPTTRFRAFESPVEAELGLKVDSARQWVADRLNRKVSTTTFYNWRSALDFIQDRYSIEDLEAICLFASFVQAGETLKSARQLTDAHYQELERNNHA